MYSSLLNWSVSVRNEKLASPASDRLSAHVDRSASAMGTTSVPGARKPRFCMSLAAWVQGQGEGLATSATQCGRLGGAGRPLWRASDVDGSAQCEQYTERANTHPPPLKGRG